MWNSTTVSIQAGSTSSTKDPNNEQKFQHQEDEEEEEEELLQESGQYQGEYYESDTSNDTGTESMTWISWFCALSGHEYFAEIAEDFIEDDFNLTGLSSTVPFYKEALEMILDVEPEEESLKVPDVSLVENSAEVLYGMIHQRYILTRQGLQQMVDKYESNHFGSCPRVYCHSTTVVPCGQSDVPGLETVKLFCPNCLDLYTPSSSRYHNIDGAYFGTTFPHLLFQQYPELLPSTQTKIYEPKIFGFKVNEKSRSGPRMQWLRMRPNDVDSDEDGEDVSDVEGENDDGEDDESWLNRGGGENNGAPETANQSGVYGTEVIRTYKLGHKSNGGNNEVLGMGTVKQEKPLAQKLLVLARDQSTREVERSKESVTTAQDGNFGMSPLVNLLPLLTAADIPKQSTLSTKTSNSSTVPPLLSSPSSSSSSLQTLTDTLPTTESNNCQSSYINTINLIQCEKDVLNSVSLVVSDKDHNILLEESPL